MKSDAAKSKGKSPSKRITRGEEKEDVEKSTASSKGQDSGGEAAEVGSRRRSSRVAKSEALSRQENSAKRKTRRNGVVAADEEGEESKGKRVTPKKSSSDMKLKEEANGETCADEGDLDADKDEAEDAGLNSTEREAWQPVYLTRFEVEGLSRLIEKLRTLRQNKKNIPPTVEDPDGLLTRLQVCDNNDSKWPCRVCRLLDYLKINYRSGCEHFSCICTTNNKDVHSTIVEPL